LAGAAALADDTSTNAASTMPAAGANARPTAVYFLMSIPLW
jgi:hypothetical protein